MIRAVRVCSSLILMILFWCGWLILVFSLIIIIGKHPLTIGGCLLILYIMGSVVVRFGVRFLLGVFLFLTGVRGIIVAFLYVVALCPNPVFELSGVKRRIRLGVIVIMVVLVSTPLFMVIIISFEGLIGDLNNISNSFQWLQDPVIFGGLANLIPFLGVLLFLCIVRVVILCGQQKQCLGGHRFTGVKRSYT